MKNITRIIALFALAYLTLGGTARAQSFPWSVQTRSVTDDSLGGAIAFQGLTAADTLHAMAWGITGRATVARTTDGGVTWPITLRLGFRLLYGQLYALAHPTPSVAVVVGDTLIAPADTGTTIFYTHDGGESWRQAWCDSCKLPDGSRFTILRLSMCDSLHGLITGGRYLIARTTDGGATWRRIPDPTNGQLALFASLFCLSPSYYIFTTQGVRTRYATLYRSNDSGKTWDTISISPYIHHITFIDSLNGWGTGSKNDSTDVGVTNTIYRTRDGGRTWAVQFNKDISIRTGSLERLAMADTLHGIATGEGGVWLYTTDGEHWNVGANIDSTIRILYGTTYGFTSTPGLAYPHPAKAWVATENSIILAYRPATAAVPNEHGIASRTTLTAVPNVGTVAGPVTFVLNLNEATAARLAISDVLGREVYNEPLGELEPGEHRATRTLHLPAGRYFVRLFTGHGTTTGSLMIMR